jgi:hypothetical protein
VSVVLLAALGVSVVLLAALGVSVVLLAALGVSVVLLAVLGFGTIPALGPALDPGPSAGIGAWTSAAAVSRSARRRSP